MRLMGRSSLAALVVLVLLVLVTTQAGAGQRHRWWKSDDVKAELGLTESQSAVIDEIYKAALPTQRELKQRLDRKEAELSELIDAMEAEEWEVTLLIDKVEAARSELSKSRILMLYRMHRELTDEQLDALHNWWDRRPRRERRAPPSR